MKEFHEQSITVGFDRDAKQIFDEIEINVARHKRNGWYLENATVDDSLGEIHLIYYREIDINSID